MRPGRRPLAVLLSVAVVAAPATATTFVGGQAVDLLGSGAVTTDATQTLLLLACAALTAVLLWATAAAAAGVREGWRCAAAGAGLFDLAATVATGAGHDPDAPARDHCVPAPGAARRAGPPTVKPLRSEGSRAGGVVATTVAALVVAALSAGPATASATDGPTPPPTGSTMTATGTAASGAAPGSWSALADRPATGPSSPHDRGRATGTAAMIPSDAPDQVTATGRDAAPTSEPVSSRPGPTGAEPFRAPRVVDPATAALVTGGPGRAAAEREVVVRAGDSLWALVAAHLGPEATDAEVADAWPSWWRANQHTIGDDPDLLRPGQRLVVPLG